MFGISSKGDFGKTLNALKKMTDGSIYKGFDGYGAMGVDALSSATPHETGETAGAWKYYIVTKQGSWQSIEWHNTHRHNNVNIVVLIKYGHGTGTGGYIPPKDFVTPAMAPVFEKIADDVWKKVTNA
jgi:hypothetical protein